MRVLFKRIKEQRITATAATVISISLIQTVLNNIAQPCTPSNALTAIGTSFVQRHVSNTRSPQDIATAVTVIEALLIQMVLNNTFQPFTPSNAPTAIETLCVLMHYSGTRNLRNIAIAPSAIGSSSMQKHLFHCCDCERDFVDEQALDQHLASKNHKPHRKAKISSLGLSDWVCEDCDRPFKDEKGLEQHRASVIHKPLSDFKCFGDQRCKKRFTSPSAWLHHLESGGCRSRITMESLNIAVQSSDSRHLITGGRNQEDAWLKGADFSSGMSTTGSTILTPLTGDGFDESSYWPASPGSQSGMLTPASTSSRRTLDSLVPASRLLCPLCPPGRKPFMSIEALTNHLSSPAHAPKIFHCPLSIAGYEDEGNISQLMKYFSTLSGLLQHLESGACQGGNTTFRKTVEYIEHNLGKNLGRMGLRKLRLLN